MTKKRKRKIEMIKAIQPTSITSLKMQCFIAAEGKIDEARKIYDYFAEGMESLPLTDPMPASFMENAKSTVNGTLEWVKDNQETLTQIYDFVRSMFGKRKAIPTPTEPLPPIN